MGANVIKNLILLFISAMMKRLFAAIKIYPDKNFMDQLHHLKIHMGHEKIKWVEDHNIHVTLKFFGETDERKIPEITRVLKKVAGENPAFGFHLQSLGIFGSKYDPRVVWIGIEPYDRLVKLMKDLHAELKTIGYEPDRQNLVPHLTIGRIKEIKDKQLFQRTIEKFRQISSSEMMATELLLYESILKKEGPVYLIQNTFHLLK
jgi:RNA 2',3'-cyclic 3'-phosphodiesterase